MDARTGEAESRTPDQDAVEQRRARLCDEDGAPLVGLEAPAIGLALSGGGIRSATFCLGVLRALAKNRVLHRFDYLSTVSGGGYVGAAFGRLFRDGVDPRDVERGLAQDDSLLLWWLRNNGRYLLPSGSADIVRAFSSQSRSFVATQYEVMVAAFFLTCAVVLPHLAYAISLEPGALPGIHASLWWWPLLPVAMAASTLSYGYWMLGMTGFQRAGVLLVSLVVGGWLLYRGLHASVEEPSVLVQLCLGLALLTLPAVPGCIGAAVSNRRRAPEINRVAYTKGLAWCFTAAGALLILGCLDMASWFLRDAMLAYLHRTPVFTLSWSIGWASMLAILARAIAPVLSSRKKEGAAALPLEAIGNVLGMALIGLVVLFWMGVFQTVLLPSDDGVLFGRQVAFLYFPALVLIGTLVLLLTGSQLQQLNRSSLHFFYRSRLARAYLSVGNYRSAGASGGRFPASPLERKSRALTRDTERVTDLLPNDDTPLADYRPHAYGGPIHLINCCINQTVDDRTGMFNADRKGVALTVGPLGVETGTQPPSGAAAASDTTLAEWVAISGAAVGSGMGSLTRPGVAVLTFLSGFRLGYWQRNLTRPGAIPRLPLAKYRTMLREMFAQFPGLDAPYWYLSDGGHFDNTGVYALLKRELSLIVLADCGADPDYRFGDVENLVRKARIDYGAGIEFVDPAALERFAGPLAARFGTPASIGPDPDCASLLLARVSYESGKRGTLLVIKPRVTPGLALDLTGYAARHPAFPQQSTINQFFSEEEWEGYCALGLALGRPIDAGLLQALPDWAWQAPVVSEAAMAQAQPETAAARASRKLATTVGTSLGAGALLTGLLAGWQAWDDSMARRQNLQAEFHTAVSEAVEGLQAHQGAFDMGLKAKLLPLSNYVDDHRLSDEQQDQARDVADEVSKRCPNTTDTKLSEECRNAAARLGGTDRPIGSFWSDSLAAYSNWPVRTAPVEFPSDALATATPPPPPPPPPPSPPPVMAAPPPDVSAERPPVATATPATAAPPPPVAAVREPQASSPPRATGAGSTVDAQRTIVQCSRADGRPYTLYTQIYDERQRASALEILSLARTLGLAVPGVENVTATAVRNQRKPPLPWTYPTLLYPPDGQTCAQALAQTLEPYLGHVQAFPLPARLSGSGTNVELWIPNPATVQLPAATPP